MSTSQIPAVLDALIATVTAAVASTTLVYDGPRVTAESSADSVVIGDDMDARNETAVLSNQSWAALGNQSRDELVDVPCAILSSSGDARDVKVVRDRAFAILAQIEGALRVTPSQGGAAVLWTEVTDFSYTAIQDAATGITAWVRFTVHARCRI